MKSKKTLEFINSINEKSETEIQVNLVGIICSNIRVFDMTSKPDKKIIAFNVQVNNSATFVSRKRATIQVKFFRLSESKVQEIQQKFKMGDKVYVSGYPRSDYWFSQKGKEKIIPQLIIEGDELEMIQKAAEQTEQPKDKPNNEPSIFY
jgi:single-stranded DNA-binding protein